MLVIKEAYDDIESVRTLFDEYATAVGVDFAVDLAFQGYDEELKTLPGKYGKPDGRLYLAYWDDELAGCAAFRPFSDGVCEMKRLYVREKFRKCKIGAELVKMLLADAKSCGYDAMLLDTLKPMTDAQKLYEGFGFEETEAYYYNPVEGAVYYRLDII